MSSYQYLVDRPEEVGNILNEEKRRKVAPGRASDVPGGFSHGPDLLHRAFHEAAAESGNVVNGFGQGDRLDSTRLTKGIARGPFDITPDSSSFSCRWSSR